MRLFFELGIHPNLSRAEIESILERQKITWYEVSSKPSYFIIETADNLSSIELMQTLGGSISIGQEIRLTGKALDRLLHHLSSVHTEGKLEFSVHGDNAKQLALLAKKELKQRGYSVRYIEPKNTATILHNKLIEKETDLTFFKEDLYVTRAIQPIEAFGARDHNRPGRDSKSGMLPPKLARMLVNLTGKQTHETILDPFCGSGTVLGEALLLGYNHIVGSDLSQKAIDDSKKNLPWLQQQTGQGKNAEIVLFCHDVSTLYQKINKESVGAIATEPYLGKPLRGNEDRGFLENQARELSALYVSAFQAFTKILKPDGVVVFIIPEFKYRDQWITINCVEKIEQLGFRAVPLSTKEPALLYHRPDQFVGRRIWKFLRDISSIC